MWEAYDAKMMRQVKLIKKQITPLSGQPQHCATDDS